MKKERWVVSAKRADFQAIADRFGIDPVIARLIRNRDVTGEKEIEEYLFGDLEQLHDPLLMKDMERAADLIAEKIREKSVIPAASGHVRRIRPGRSFTGVIWRESAAALPILQTLASEAST